MKTIEEELARINDYERNLRKIKLDNDTHLIAKVNDSLELNINDEEFTIPINRSVIHQIGSKIWTEYDNNFWEVRQKWNAEIQKDKYKFEGKIAESLIEKKSILLIDNMQDELYGIISPNFHYIDVVNFRKKFLEIYRDYGIPFDSSITSKTQFGEVIENFSFENKKRKIVGEPMKYDIGIIYGLNNGYSSFRFGIERTILVCKNGLTKVEKDKFIQLKHTKDYNIESFVKNMLGNVTEFEEEFQTKISEAKTRQLSKSASNEFIDKMFVPQIVKERVKLRVEDEKNIYGNNEWALSQAFTYLATHFYTGSFNKTNSQVLRDKGSQILDYSLEEAISNIRRN